jgi:hypothetical protein
MAFTDDSILLPFVNGKSVKKYNNELLKNI